MVCQRSGRWHRTRGLADDTMMALSSTDNQLLYFENLNSPTMESQEHHTSYSVSKLTPHDFSSQLIALPVELLQQNSQVKLRYDLHDCHISICSPEVLSLFTDNFDWAHFHTDFLKNVLGSDLLGHRMFVHILGPQEYAARVEDLRQYDSVSRDIINRIAYPYKPDGNLFAAATVESCASPAVSYDNPQSSYQLERGLRYREASNIARSAEFGSNCVIGLNCRIAEQCSLKRSVLGRSCILAAGAQITDSYLWPGVTVGARCKVDRAIICTGAVLGDECVIGACFSASLLFCLLFLIRLPPFSRAPAVLSPPKLTFSRFFSSEPGVIIGYNVQLPAKTIIRAHTRLYKPSSVRAIAPDAVPQSSKPYVEWREPENDDMEEAEWVDQHFHLNSLAPDLAGYLDYLRRTQPDRFEDEEFDDNEVYEHADTIGDASQSSSAMIESKTSQFMHEIGETLKRGELQQLDVHGIEMEASSLKLSFNASLQVYAAGCMQAILELAGAPQSNETGKATGEPLKALRRLIKRWQPVLAKFCVRDEEQMNHIFGRSLSLSLHSLLPF